MKSVSTHIKYDHFHFPRKIELKCPRCKMKSDASNMNVPETSEYFIDISDYEKTWEFKCTNCIKTQSLNWKESQKIELWNKIEIKGEVVWAWNSKHMDMILKRLKNESIDNHQWEFFASYINKSWLKKINKESDWRKIELLILKE